MEIKKVIYFSESDLKKIIEFHLKSTYGMAYNYSVEYRVSDSDRNSIFSASLIDCDIEKFKVRILISISWEIKRIRTFLEKNFNPEDSISGLLSTEYKDFPRGVGKVTYFQLIGLLRGLIPNLDSFAIARAAL
ncbi:MAG: hypothetical protein RL687_104 [Candidatus Parcubacteria bacterium]|jgi:hypothetical protein